MSGRPCDEVDFLLALLKEEDEEVVASLLDDAGYSLDNRELWVPLGDNPANFTTVGNQQENPSAALVEKLVNSIDAVLLSECHRNGIDPESQGAPQSMQAAVDAFLGVKDGRLDYLTPGEQTSLADKIHMVATGEKSNPCYCIVDEGEGQTPETFPRTFLSTTRRSPKERIPFVQGRFNAGGTGSIQFSGKRNIQLIISKRQPHAPTETSDSSAEMWGWTVVRRRRGRGEDSSVFEYLAPNRAIPRVDVPSLPLLPTRTSGNEPPAPYTREMTAGTCVKLYNYRWRQRTIATLDARFELERYLQTPCLPFRIDETRNYTGTNYYSTTVIGVWNALGAEPRDSADGRLEAGFPATAEISLPDVGRLPVRLAVFKEWTENKKGEKTKIKTRNLTTGVAFLANGQVHGNFPRDFASRTLGFDYLADHLLVSVDCTHIDRGVFEDVFMPSRDRMRKNEDYAEIRRALVDELKHHPGLKELNALRRQQRREQQPDDDDLARNILNDLIRRDPALANLFGKGSGLVTGTGPGPRSRFEGRKFPSYFRLKKEPKGTLVKHCPVNQTVRLEFETDADNDYFSRPDSPGQLEVRPSVDLIESSRLWNGTFAVRFRVPWDATPGDVTKVSLLVTDVEREALGPFATHFELFADEPAKPQKPRPGGRENPRGEPSPKPSDRNASLELPEPIEVKKSDWESCGFDVRRGLHQALRVKRSGEEGFDFYVNVDNSALITEMENPKQDPQQVRSWFKWGLTLIALSMIQEQTKRAEDDEGVALDQIGFACDGIARVIIPIIRTLPSLE